MTGARVLMGDNIASLRRLAREGVQVDSVVTDPPYGLSFMGKQWDYDVPTAEFWRAVFDVLKPGGYVLSFGGTRTYHRMACALEDAGFELRDMLSWLYGSGFPKSLDVSKAIDKAAGATREKVRLSADKVGNFKNRSDTRPFIESAKRKGFHEIDGIKPATAAAREWAGFGTALKPACEPIALARKPFAGTVAGNVLAFRTGALNIDGCRIESEKQTGWESRPAGGQTWNVLNCGLAKRGAARPVSGRWPANVLLDEDAAAALGEPSRFFYCAKASAKERAGSKHPTVKPVALMRYLCRLVTPPGGLVLDPFAGSGTTGEAALLEGFSVVLMEREAAYREDIRRRVAA